MAKRKVQRDKQRSTKQNMLFVSTVLVKTHKQFILCDNMELMTFDEFDILISLSMKMFVTDRVIQGEYPFSGIEQHYSN